MALGYNEDEASGLIVWNMNEFEHPGAGIPITHKCRGIYCTWFNDGGPHGHRASDTETLYDQLRKHGAKKIGKLAKMDCNGNSNV